MPSLVHPPRRHLAFTLLAAVVAAAAAADEVQPLVPPFHKFEKPTAAVCTSRAAEEAEWTSKAQAALHAINHPADCTTAGHPRPRQLTP
jgi:hypothetical protein